MLYLKSKDILQKDLKSDIYYLIADLWEYTYLGPRLYIHKIYIIINIILCRKNVRIISILCIREIFTKLSQKLWKLYKLMSSNIYKI